MNTVHAVVVDQSLDDGENLEVALMSLGVERVDYFSNAEMAKATFKTNRSAFSRRIIFIRDEPYFEASLFIRSIMSDPDFSSMFVILTTSKLSSTEILWAFRLGAVGHLQIPIETKKLAAIISAAKFRRFRIA